MQQSVRQGGDENAGSGEEGNTRIEGVERCEELAAFRAQHVHQSHASQDHGSVEQGVDP